MTEKEKAMIDVEMAECDIEDGKIASAHRHIHRAISRMDGDISGDVGDAIRAAARRLE